MKEVYVTGCLGFIGSYVTRACLERGWCVIGVDKITYAANPELLNEFKSNKNFKFIQSDINDLEFLYDCDYIINCAAETHVDNSIVDSDVFVKSNIDGVHNLLELIRKRQKYKMPTLLHFSTDEVYGDILSGSHNESSMLKPSNPYSATKASADMLVTAWGRTFNIPYIIVRPTNNYGIGQYTEKLIPKAIKYLQLGRKIPVHEHGMPKRTWLHVTDTAKAIIRIIDHGKLGEIYNISGNYENKNIIVLGKIISQFFGSDDFEMSDHVDFSYSRPGQDVRYSICDSKLRELGWNPIADFDDKIKQIVDYHKNIFKW